MLKGYTEHAQNMDIGNWMIKSNTHREHWWRKLLFHLWIFFYFCCKWQKWSERVILLESVWLPSDQTLCVFGYLHAQPLCRGPATDRIWRLRMLILLTGTGEGANRNTPLSLRVMCSWTGQNYGFFFVVVVDFLNAWKVIHSFLHLLVAQYALWFLLLQVLWMWHLLAFCLS